MSPKLLLIFFIILSYAGVFFVFRKRSLSLLVGMEYLLLGFLFSLVDIEIDSLKPLLFPFLGWIGFLTGSQLKLKYVLRLDKKFYLSVILFTVLLTGTITVVLSALLSAEHAVLIAIALVPISYRTVAQFITEDRFVLFFIGIIPFLAMLLLLLFYFVRLTMDSLLLMVIFILVFSIISRFILTHLDDKKSINLLLVGLIIFISESCAVLGLSSLVVNFCVGIYIANFCPYRDIIFSALYKDEKQLYIMFLLLLGMFAGIRLEPAVFLNSLLIILVVLCCKYLFLKITYFQLQSHHWFYFLAPGGFAITLATDFWLFEGGARASAWFSSFLVSVISLQCISVLMSKSYEV